MRSANTPMPSAKHVMKKCAANSGMICCSIWPVTWSALVRIEPSLVPSSADQNPTHYSTNRATASWKSLIAAATGKDTPAIIEGLTKGHSGQTHAGTLDERVQPIPIGGGFVHRLLGRPNRED